MPTKRRGAHESSLMREQFLSAFARHLGDVRAAREEVGVSPDTFAWWMKKHPEFRTRLDEIRTAIAEEIEGEAFRRSTGGKASDHLITFMLRGLKRQRYGDQVSQTPPHVVYVSLLRGDGSAEGHRGGDQQGDRVPAEAGPRALPAGSVPGVPRGDADPVESTGGGDAPGT